MATIIVQKQGSDAVAVARAWWIDDDEDGWRYSHDRITYPHQRNPAELRRELDAALQEITLWQRGQWTDISSFGEGDVGQYSEEDYKTVREHIYTYPLPDLTGLRKRDTP